jgi:hypothetical protein
MYLCALFDFPSLFIVVHADRIICLSVGKRYGISNKIQVYTLLFISYSRPI